MGYFQPLANTAYLASYADTDYGDIRGLEIPEGVDDLTITSSLGTGHILGAGDVDDSGTIIFSSFLFGEDAPGNTNLTIEKLLLEDFEGAISLGWNNVGSYSGTMIQDNEIVLAGDNSDDSDWIQNIAFLFLGWVEPDHPEQHGHLPGGWSPYGYFHQRFVWLISLEQVVEVLMTGS